MRALVAGCRDRVSQCRELFGAARCQRTFMAALGQKPRESSTDSSRGAGDQSDWVRGGRQSITCLRAAFLRHAWNVLEAFSSTTFNQACGQVPEGHRRDGASKALPWAHLSGARWRQSWRQAHDSMTIHRSASRTKAPLRQQKVHLWKVVLKTVSQKSQAGANCNWPWQPWPTLIF